MLTLIASGGLGNQLFQYAAARSQSLRLDVPLLVDTRFYNSFDISDPKSFKLHYFPIQAQIKHYPSNGPFSAHGLPRRIWRKLAAVVGHNMYREPGLGFDPEFLSTVKNTTIYGEFQSYRYFGDVCDALLRELDLGAAFRAIGGTSKVEPYEEYISIHVRRGDYVELDGFWMEDSDRYYKKAIDLFKSTHENARFLVFSDDISWCRRRGFFDTYCRFFDHSEIPDIGHLYIMSRCRGHIVANSSFSLWAAVYTGRDDKMVVAPKQWVGGLSTDALEFSMPNWIMI